MYGDVFCSGNNCQLPRSRPYVSVLMEFPSVSESSNAYGQPSFWSSLAAHSPLKPRPLSLISEHANGFATTNGRVQHHQPPTLCALWPCALRCVRVVVERARDCVTRGPGAPARVYGITSDTLSSENTSRAPLSPPLTTRDSPPYLPSGPIKHLNGNGHSNGNTNGVNGHGTVRDLPV